jgi:DUF1009 family protein
MRLLGIIAGNRSFPLHLARAAKAQGYSVVAVGLKEETDPLLEKEVDRMHWVSFSEIGKVPGLLKEAGVRDLVLAGQIRPERLLGEGVQLDTITAGLLRAVPDRSGTTAMQMAVRYLESKRFRVLHSGIFLKEWIPSRGCLTKLDFTPEQKADARFGFSVAHRMAHWKIGQTVVVRHKAVAAVEAVEGTDETIRRAGQRVGPGCLAVKACEPGHDMRFDIPVVGLDTIRALSDAAAVGMAVEAGKVLLFERDKVIAEADRLGLRMVAL